MSTDYDPITCPMPDCDAPLYLTRTTSLGLSRGVVTVADDSWLPSPADADTASWQVQCGEGHVVLVPGSPGCPCGADECDHVGFDESEEVRQFRAHDVERLATVLAAFSTQPQ